MDGPPITQKHAWPVMDKIRTYAPQSKSFDNPTKCKICFLDPNMAKNEQD
jgi:hypothetical protein